MWNLEWILKDSELHFINVMGRNDSISRQCFISLQKNINYLNSVNLKIIKIKLRPEVVEFVEKEYTQ